MIKKLFNIFIVFQNLIIYMKNILFLSVLILSKNVIEHLKSKYDFERTWADLF
jgi:hypothetical protein